MRSALVNKCVRKYESRSRYECSVNEYIQTEYSKSTVSIQCDCDRFCVRLLVLMLEGKSHENQS